MICPPVALQLGPNLLEIKTPTLLLETRVRPGAETAALVRLQVTRVDTQAENKEA